jgi:hypothetical protein
MTPAEIAAMRDLEAAEQAVSNAVVAREAARKRLADIMSRERLGERAKDRARTHLRLVASSRR